MNDPRVAIAIVNYRTPDETIACVRSLRSLHYSTFDVIVVDNDSGDGSASILRRELPEARVLEAPENGGYTAGNNLGIEAALAADAEYILVLNPDTVSINDRFLDDLVDFMNCHPSAGAVGPKVYWGREGNVQNTDLRFPWLHRRIIDGIWHRIAGRPARSGNAVQKVEVLNGVCVLFRTEAMQEVGHFDPRTFAYIEDVDWAWRAERAAWQRWYCPTPSIVHLQKQAGYERGGTVDYLLKRNTLYFLLKSGKRLQAAGYLLCTLAIGLLGCLQRGERGRQWFNAYARSAWFLFLGMPDRVMGAPSAVKRKSEQRTSAPARGPIPNAPREVAA